MRVPIFLASILGFLSLVSPLFGVDVPFIDAAALSTSVDGPTCIRSGDLDNDGDIDIAAVIFNSQEVCWFENNGSASFTKHEVVTSLDNLVYLVVGDIDGDGDLDLVACSRDWDDPVGVSWYENPVVGSGSIWTEHALPSAGEQGTNSLALGDLDRDGDLDVVYATEGGGNSALLWIANNGDGSGWTAHAINLFSSGVNAFDTEVADVDGDGDFDVIASLAVADEIRWWENDGGSPPGDNWSSHVIDVTMDGAAAVAAGDIDGDGDIDVVASGYYADRISWYERSGSTWTEHVVRSSFNGAWSVTLVDMDLDRDLDVLATAFEADQVVWFENTVGDGSDWLFRGIEADFDGARWAVAADLDGDGDPDVAAAADFGDTIDRWDNRTIHRTYTIQASTTIIRDQMFGADSVATGDVNCDGIPDVVSGLYSSDTVVVLFGLDPDVGLWWEDDVTTSLNGVADVGLADLDQDGDLDIITAAADANLVTVWSNGGGVLPAWSATDILTGFHAMVVGTGDCDGDGDEDVVVAGYDEDTILWLENGNSWASHVVRSDIDGPLDLAVADINNDGFADIVASASVGDRVVAYLNFDGSGTLWWEADIVTSWNIPRGVEIADINSDGAPDVVAASVSEDEIAWFENDGTGTGWTTHSISTTVDGPVAVKAGDFDADGDTDLVSIEVTSGRFVWWENEGEATGWNLDGQGFLSTYHPLDLAIEDINGDSYPDFVLVVDASTGGGLDDTIGWIKNIGGQYYAHGWATPDDEWANGESKEVFAIPLSHLGRAEDSGIELTQLKVQFEDAEGTPLTTPEANNLFDRLEIFRDTNGNYDWDGGDLEILEISYLALTASGEQTITFADGDSDVAVPATSGRHFFVVLTTEADASSSPLNRFRLRLPEEQILAEDAVYDIELHQSVDGYAVKTQIMELTGPLFADGFESGDTSRWSMVVQ